MMIRSMAAAGRMPTSTAIAAAAAMLLSGASAAAAQSCAGEAYRLARQYGLSLEGPLRAAAAEAPAAPTRPPAWSLGTRLKRRDGIIPPPEIDDRLALAPPAGDVGDRLALALPVCDPWQGALGELDASEQAAMAALLREALGAERRGEVSECYARLREAEERTTRRRSR
jgi:hypothetical protein